MFPIRPLTHPTSKRSGLLTLLNVRLHPIHGLAEVMLPHIQKTATSPSLELKASYTLDTKVRRFDKKRIVKRYLEWNICTQFSWPKDIDGR